LFKIVIQGVSLWHFHIYMYYSSNWFISSIFLLSTLFPIVLISFSFLHYLVKGEVTKSSSWQPISLDSNFVQY
jgi:hypothetical protein